MKEEQTDFDSRGLEMVCVCTISANKFGVLNPIDGNWELGPKNLAVLEAIADAVGTSVKLLLQELIKEKYSGTFKVDSHIKVIRMEGDLVPQREVEAFGIDLKPVQINELRKFITLFASLISEEEGGNDVRTEVLDPRDLSMLIKYQQSFLATHGGKKLSCPIVLSEGSGVEISRITAGIAALNPEKIESDEFEGHARVIMLSKETESCKLEYEFFGPEDNISSKVVKFIPGRHWAQLHEALGKDSPYKFLLKKQADEAVNGRLKKGRWTIQNMCDPDDGFLL